MANHTLKIQKPNEPAISIWFSAHQVDLVIIDDSFNEYCLPIVEKLGVPFIFYSASTGYPSTWASMGASQELATIPNRFSGFDNEMDFYQRLQNAVTVSVVQLIRNWYTIPAMDRHISADFPNTRSILDIERDASLFFISSKSATSWTRPLPPTVIPLGPLHVRAAVALPSVGPIFQFEIDVMFIFDW